MYFLASHAAGLLFLFYIKFFASTILTSCVTELLKFGYTVYVQCVLCLMYRTTTLSSQVVIVHVVRFLWRVHAAWMRSHFVATCVAVRGRGAFRTRAEFRTCAKCLGLGDGSRIGQRGAAASGSLECTSDGRIFMSVINFLLKLLLISSLGAWIVRISFV